MVAMTMVMMMLVIMVMVIMFVFMLMVVIVVLMLMVVVMVMMVMFVIVVTVRMCMATFFAIFFLRRVLAFLRFSSQMRRTIQVRTCRSYEQDVRQGLGFLQRH